MDPLLLCTDLDRTLLPNGEVEEGPGVRARFARVVTRPEITLAYVSGRHLEAMLAAVRDYDLPGPEYAICDVGSTIYCARDAASSRTRPRDWQIQESWRQRLAESWTGDTATAAREALADFDSLTLQEEERQGPFKLSFTTPVADDPRPLLQAVEERLRARGLEALLVYSVDDLRRIGLLDLLPKGSGKRAAIEHLIEEGGFALERTLFAGDSGNDLEVLVSSIPSVLVANASAEIQRRAHEGALRAGSADRLYLAGGGLLGMNGNYAAGILEGLAHFWPETEEWMR